MDKEKITVVPEVRAEEGKQKKKITDFSTLVKISVKEWWENIEKFIHIYIKALYYAIIPLIIFIIPEIWPSIFNPVVTDYVLLASVFLFLRMLALIALFYVSIRLQIGILHLIKNDYKETGSDAYKQSKEYFFPFLYLSILLFTVVLLWSLLLIIPGIIFSVLYSLSVFVFFFQEKRGWQAMKESKRLVKGHWWSVFLKSMGISLLIWLASTVLFITFFYVVVSFSGTDSLVADISIDIINIIIGIIFAPLSVVYISKIYKDLVKIK